MKVITICGSLKYKDEMMTVAQKLSLDGNCVLTPVYPVGDKKPSEEELKILKEAHFKRIEMSDEIFVLNIDGYVGESTKLEIEYAEKLGKVIEYYSKN